VVALGALSLLAVGALAAACSTNGNGPSVASLPDDHSAPATASPAQASQSARDRDVVAFTRCLRAHGVNEPDPFTRPGNSGLTFDMPPANAANRSALATCEHFISKIVAAKQAGASQELARWLPGLVRYASCMRSHDIAMLDPDAQGQLNLGRIPGISNAIGRYSPQFRSADRSCRHLLPAGVRDDGTGP
jgi:hypothetical protein